MWSFLFSLEPFILGLRLGVMPAFLETFFTKDSNVGWIDLACL